MASKTASIDVQRAQLIEQLLKLELSTGSKRPAATTVKKVAASQASTVKSQASTSESRKDRAACAKVALVPKATANSYFKAETYNDWDKLTTALSCAAQADLLAFIKANKIHRPSNSTALDAVVDWIMEVV
jgi:hypothetical protein